MNNNPMEIGVPMQRLIGVLVFLFPFLSLITPSGIGFSSLVFVVAFLCVPRKAWRAIAPHWREIRWVVAAFAFNCLFALACVLLRPETSASHLDTPSRMLFGIAATMLVVLAKTRRSVLWWGVTAGAVAALPFVSWQRIVLDELRPGGWLNPITFGDLSLCLSLVALAAAIDYRSSTRKAILPAVGAVAGLAGMIMTGTRGGWIALALAAVLFLTYARLLRSRRVRLLVVGSFALFASTFFIPATGMAERVGQGVYDVQTWMDGGSAYTNVGIRLELWTGAKYLIEEKPLFGRDRDTAHAALEELVKQGKLQDVVLAPDHMHNDAIQALTTGGIVGLLAWIGILAAPFAFFARALGRSAYRGETRLSPKDAQMFAPALAGMLVVLSYFSFGLTEVIFWSLKGSMFYALMVFLLMGFCLNAKANLDNTHGQ